jgi:hypothetical protein
MAPLKIEIDTVPPLSDPLPEEPTMAVQVEELVQAVAEGVLRAVEARGGSAPGAQAATAAASQADGATRSGLISQLSFEVRIRAGGIPGPVAFSATAE